LTYEFVRHFNALSNDLGDSYFFGFISNEQARIFPFKSGLQRMATNTGLKKSNTLWFSPISYVRSALLRAQPRKGQDPPNWPLVFDPSIRFRAKGAASPLQKPPAMHGPQHQA
jgi:hypothetical protein